jgi:hypothetical protein
MPVTDFNAVILILDTVSEGGNSFTELADYVGRQYGRDVIAQSLRLVCKRELVALFDGRPGEDRVLKNEWQSAADDFFVIAQQDRDSVASHFIELTDAGRQVLDVLGIGSP